MTEIEKALEVFWSTDSEEAYARTKAAILAAIEEERAEANGVIRDGWESRALAAGDEGERLSRDKASLAQRHIAADSDCERAEQERDEARAEVERVKGAKWEAACLLTGHVATHAQQTIARLTAERDECAEDARRNSERVARLVVANTELNKEVAAAREEAKGYAAALERIATTYQTVAPFYLGEIARAALDVKEGKP